MAKGVLTCIVEKHDEKKKMESLNLPTNDHQHEKDLPKTVNHQHEKRR
jgi:hypothetical protein